MQKRNRIKKAIIGGILITMIVSMLYFLSPVETLYCLGNNGFEKIGTFNTRIRIDTIGHINFYGICLTDKGNIAYYDYDEKQELYLKIYNSKSKDITSHKIEFNNVISNNSSKDYISISHLAVNQEHNYMAFINKNDIHNHYDSSIVVYDYLNNSIIYYEKIESYYENAYISFTNNCDGIIYSVYKNHNSYIYTLNFIDGNKKLILNDIYCLNISQSGNKIAYRKDEDIFVYDINDNVTYKLSVEYESLDAVTFSQDESELIVTFSKPHPFSFSNDWIPVVYKWEYKTGKNKKIMQSFFRLDCVPYFLIKN